MEKFFEALEKSKNQVVLGIVNQVGFDETADILEKGRAAAMGEIREWKGERYQKTPNGWIPVKTGQGGTVSEGPKEKEKGDKIDIENVTSLNELKRLFEGRKGMYYNKEKDSFLTGDVKVKKSSGYWANLSIGGKNVMTINWSGGKFFPDDLRGLVSSEGAVWKSGSVGIKIEGYASDLEVPESKEAEREWGGLGGEEFKDPKLQAWFQKWKEKNYFKETSPSKDNSEKKYTWVFDGKDMDVRVTKKDAEERLREILKDDLSKRVSQPLKNAFLKDHPEFKNRGWWSFGSKSFTPVVYHLPEHFIKWANENKKEPTSDNFSDFLKYAEKEIVPSWNKALENGQLYLHE